MDISALNESIKNLESTNDHLTTRLAIVENNLESYQKRIKATERRIYHEGRLFSYATETKDITLEELAKTFKNHVERFQEAQRWQAEKVGPVEDHAARLQRLENSNKGNFEHLLECMKKLGVKFRMDAGDDIAGMLISMGVEAQAAPLSPPSPPTSPPPSPPSPPPSFSPSTPAPENDPRKSSGLQASKWASSVPSPSSSSSSPSLSTPAAPENKGSGGLQGSKWASASIDNKTKKRRSKPKPKGERRPPTASKRTLSPVLAHAPSENKEQKKQCLHGIGGSKWATS